MAVGRWKKKIMSKETWYKDKSGDQESGGGQKKKAWFEEELSRNSNQHSDFHTFL